MGLRDFFRRKKEPVQNNQQAYGENAKQPLTLNYRDGSRADVSFGEIKQVDVGDGQVKMLKEVKVQHTNQKGVFETKSYFAEPMVTKDENGNEIDVTEEYYTNLAATNMPLAKGFFKREEIDKLGSNYIGYIGCDQNGRYNRSFDQMFRVKYQAFCERQSRIQQQQERETREKRENDIRDILRDQTNPPNIKTVHAERLTPEMRVQQFGNPGEDHESR